MEQCSSGRKAHQIATAANAGVGLKPQHAREILAGENGIDFYEVHAENYMGDGGPPHDLLTRVRERHPLSIHGVGLSIGGAQPLDSAHLERLKRLNDRYQPVLFSEHLAWSSHDGVFLNDLLPVPYNNEALNRVCEHIDQVQTYLKQRILLENPSTYVEFECSSISEPDFLRDVVSRTGCGLLLDINNVYVSAVNHVFEPMCYLDSFPIEQVGEIHLAGYAEDTDGAGSRLLIDAHDTKVSEVVWALFRRIIARTGPIPTLIEWDNNIPEFSVLAKEAARAREVTAGAIRRSNERIAA